MIAVDRQAIHPHGPIVVEPFDILLPAVVAVVAQRLQSAEPELVGVITVRGDVIGARGGDRTPAFAQAHLTQRRNAELMLSYPSPALGSVETTHRFP